MVATIRVLHVDDEPGFADLTADLLERADDIAVDTETDPEEALDRLDDDVYDCVVSDHDMPETTGIELLETVREAYPDLPFVLFTGKGSEAVASEAIAAGVSGYLQKESGTEQYELLANRIRTLVERARTQQKLADRESHLRQAQAVANLGSWEKDIRDDEIYWSEEVYEIFGVDDDDALIDHDQFLEYVHSADRAAVDEAWAAAIEGDDYDIEHRIVTEGGKHRWVRERAEITFDENGEPINALGVVQDITDRKRREKRLQTSTTRLEALFESSPDMINFHDAEGNIVRPNPMLCEKTGYSAAELSEMNVADLDAEIDPETAAAIWNGMAPGESHRLETAYRHRDGTTFPVEVHIRRLEDPRNDHFVVISRDIRDRRQRERELERHTERLEVFAEVLSHDIPNHLRTADGSLQLARERDRDDFEELFDRIERSHRRIETLLEDMETLIEVGRRPMDRSWVRLGPIAETSWNSCCSASDAPDLETDRVERWQLRADERQLRQLFENLYWNACEHVGGDVTVQVGPIESDADGFYVEDDGPGIDPEIRDDVLTAGYTGVGDAHAGFGLAIVEEIAEAHGWELRVTESEAGGARFEFTGADLRR